MVGVEYLKRLCNGSTHKVELDEKSLKSLEVTEPFKLVCRVSGCCVHLGSRV